MADPFARALKDGARGLRRMPPELRKRTGAHVHDQVAVPLAASVRSTFTGPWAARLAAGTKTRRAADPTLSIGGARAVVSGGASVRQLIYGDQFGGGRRPTTRQFRNRGSRSVFRTFRQEGDQVFRRWAEVLDPLLEEWEGGGG